MPKPDPSTLRLPQFAEDFQVFTDPANPDEKWPIRLRVRKSVAKDMAIRQKVRDLTTDYITGRAGGKPAIFKVNGERLEVTPDLCASASVLSTYEVPEDGEAAYTALEWFTLSETAPSMMESVLEMYSRLEQAANELSKN